MNWQHSIGHYILFRLSSLNDSLYDQHATLPTQNGLSGCVVTVPHESVIRFKTHEPQRVISSDFKAVHDDQKSGGIRRTSVKCYLPSTLTELIRSADPVPTGDRAGRGRCFMGDSKSQIFRRG